MHVRAVALTALLALASCARPNGGGESNTQAVLSSVALAHLNEAGLTAGTYTSQRVGVVSPRVPYTETLALVGEGWSHFETPDEPAGSLVVTKPQSAPDTIGPTNPPFVGLVFKAKADRYYLLDCALTVNDGSVRVQWRRLDNNALGFGDKTQQILNKQLVQVSDRTAEDAPSAAYFVPLSSDAKVGACSLFEIDPN